MAAQNPCPCGYAGDQDMSCTCSPSQVQRYGSKISGPLLDRLDLVVNLVRVKKSQLLEAPVADSSSDVAKRVSRARDLQSKRFESEKITTNNEMNNKQILKFCQLDTKAIGLLDQAINNLKLSARAYMRVLKVGRTIADLDASNDIGARHIAEALQYRV